MLPAVNCANPQIDRVALLDRQDLGGFDETAIEPNATAIDSGVEHLAMAFTAVRMAQFRMIDTALVVSTSRRQRSNTSWRLPSSSIQWI